MAELLHFDDGPITNEITSRQVTIAIIPHITALFSVLGSLFITIDIVRDKKKQQMIFHRIMLGMSISDLVASLFLFLSTWAIPNDTEGIHGAVGNMNTCQAQGFFIQLGVGTFFYTAYLAMYYLCMMRYQWKERDFQKIEPWAHGLAAFMSFGTAIASLFLQLYNNANLWCWIAPYPLDCLNSSKNNGVTTCERGDNAYIYRIAFFFVWMWLAVIVVTVCMSLVVYTVWSQRKTMQKWNPDISSSRISMTKNKSSRISMTSSNNNNNRDSLLKAVAVQACLYIGAFLLTAIFPSLVRMFQAKWNCTSTFYPLTIMTVTFFPLQGFWNAFIYVRPRFQKASKDHPTWSYCQAVNYTIARTMGCGRFWDDQDYKLGATCCEDHSTTKEMSCSNDKSDPSSIRLSTTTNFYKQQSTRSTTMHDMSAAALDEEDEDALAPCSRTEEEEEKEESSSSSYDSKRDRPPTYRPSQELWVKDSEEVKEDES